MVPAPHSLSHPSRVFAWCGTRFAGTGVDTLFALDRQLGDIVRTTAQPVIGQVRLRWWGDALERLATQTAPPQPLLRDVKADVLAKGVNAASLATMIDAWESLLTGEDHAPDFLTQFAHGRGSALFHAAARLLGETNDRVGQAGALWALADLVANVSSDDVRVRATANARSLTDGLFATRWREARVFGALALDAQAALEGSGIADGPRRAVQAARFRMIGR